MLLLLLLVLAGTGLLNEELGLGTVAAAAAVAAGAVDFSNCWNLLLLADTLLVVEPPLLLTPAPEEVEATSRPLGAVLLAP